MNLQDTIIACQNAVGAQADGVAGLETWSKIYAKLIGGAPPFIGSPNPADQTYTAFADGNHNDPWPPPTGLPAFIHKATQGTYFQDPKGAARRDQFKAGGGKWGWYHFTSGEDPAAQAHNFLGFLQKAGYQPDELVCLDFEDSANDGTSNMTAAHAQQWITLVEAALHCKVCIYGSDLLTGALRDDPTAFAGRPLWPAWYHSTPPSLPGNRPWAIWQYTDSGEPYADMDRFPGNVAELQAAWPNGLRT